eukprot:Sspe_Gene.47628::Locus_24394_Transcript_1_1_Confidence_1.000_Length_1857::g.47628::m.47628
MLNALPHPCRWWCCNMPGVKGTVGRTLKRVNSCIREALTRPWRWLDVPVHVRGWIAVTLGTLVHITAALRLVSLSRAHVTDTRTWGRHVGLAWFGSSVCCWLAGVKRTPHTFAPAKYQWVADIASNTLGAMVMAQYVRLALWVVSSTGFRPLPYVPAFFLLASEQLLCATGTHLTNVEEDYSSSDGSPHSKE